jgi:polysaccharide biosynthesis transport protein
MTEDPVEHEGDLGQSLDRIVALLIRRRWLIIGTVCTIGIATIVVLLQLPNRYTSEATILLVQQQVPERYVVPTTTSDLSQALDAVVQEVLSRPRLLGIIDEFDLYSKQKTRLTPEALIETVREDVSIKPLTNQGQREMNAFNISFVADNPQLAQAVTTKLTTLFIEQNLKTRADQAATTTVFLREQLDIAKTKLIEQEQRLKDFKMQYLGELPEQQQGNVNILGGLQNQLDNVMSNRNQAQQQKLYLESLLGEQRRLGRRAALTGMSAGGQVVVTPLEAAQRDLARLQTERRALLTVYTLQHPDVLKKNQEIIVAQNVVSELHAARAAAIPDQPTNEAAASDSEDNFGIAQLRSQLQANSLEMDNLAKNEQKLRTEIEQYKGRLNLTPVREQQLTAMQRDYDLLRQHYGELLKKEQESQLSTNLEKRQEGQQFRLADPPTLPTRPSSPKRMKISLMAFAGGLVLGCVFAFLADLRNSTLNSEADLSGRLALPLVIGVPLFFTEAEKRTRSRKRALEWIAACALLFIIAVAEMYVYRRG